MSEELDRLRNDLRIRALNKRKIMSGFAMPETGGIGELGEVSFDVTARDGEGRIKSFAAQYPNGDKISFYVTERTSEGKIKKFRIES